MKTAWEILQEKGDTMFSVTPDTTIFDALQTMVEKNIGAILIKEGDKIVGIWTERDLMRNVAKPDFDPKSARIVDHMTRNLMSAPFTATVYNLKDIFLGKRLRHLLIEKDGKYIGLLSAGDVMRASLQEKDQELHSLNAIMNWDYYENWKWRKKN